MNFWSCLFDKNESTCFAMEPSGTSIRLVHGTQQERFAFFSINPIDSAMDRNPTEEWHAPTKPRRADDNVTVFRNILIEFDKLELDEQREYVSEIALPYSTAVFSGSKSIHFIISLVSPLPDRGSYDSLVRRVYKAVGNRKIDRACKNPSRLSRVPGHLRGDTDAVQELLRVQGRVDNNALESWLISHGAPPEEAGWEEVCGPRKERDFSSLSPFTQLFLMNGRETERGEWNPKLFKAAADLCRCGWSLDEATDMLRQVTGILDRNDEKTIRSAFKNELGGKVG